MPKIGFIGQGWIGKNYSDDLERRGFSVVRYSKELEYQNNAAKLLDCDIVFIAVPTPTTPDGFDYSIVDNVLQLVRPGATAVIKSTLLPGTTAKLSDKYPQLYVMHSPEFLVEVTAAYDAAHPKRNIIGIPVMNDEFRCRAQEVLDVLPAANFTAIVPAASAELIKYAGNCLLYNKVVFINMLFDVARTLGLEWEPIKQAIAADARLGWTHLDPVHQSGRGAGGHCFIKDFAAFADFYTELVGDPEGCAVLNTIEGKNIQLLTSSNKDLPLLKSCGLI